MTDTPAVPPLPSFEGRVVDAASVKVSGGAGALTDIDAVLRVDDRVLLLCEYRCTGVRHTVDEKTGKLIREHAIKPIMMALHPWDPTDPNDDGIIRALGK